MLKKWIMKRRVWYRALNICITCLSMWYILCCPVKASEADYVITPIITDDALEDEELYFDLTIEPSRQQVIKIEARNNTDRAVTVYTKVYTAEKDLSELLEGENRITIPAQKTYLFQFTVNMPAEGLDSPLAGAFAFLLVPDRQENSTEALPAETDMVQPEGIEFLELSTDTLSRPETIKEEVENLLQETDIASSVSAEFSYVIPLVVKAGESTPSPVLSIKDISTTDYKNEVKAKIQNTTSIFAEKVTIEATVRKKGKKEIFFEAGEENIDIPAHFDYELSIPSKGKEVKTGVYTLQIKLSTARAQWQWEKDFTIAEEKTEARTENESNTQGATVKSGQYHFIIIPTFVLGIGMIAAFIILYRKKQIEKEAVRRVMIDIKKNI